MVTDTEEADTSIAETVDSSAQTCTDIKKETFLKAYTEVGTIKHSYEAAGVCRRTIYNWLDDDEAFKVAFGYAKEDFVDTLKREAYRRGITPNASKMSDALLMFDIKAHDPSFRDQVTIAPSEHTITFKVVRVDEIDYVKPEVIEAPKQLRESTLDITPDPDNP